MKRFYVCYSVPYAFNRHELEWSAPYSVTTKKEAERLFMFEHGKIESLEIIKIFSRDF